MADLAPVYVELRAMMLAVADGLGIVVGLIVGVGRHQNRPARPFRIGVLALDLVELLGSQQVFLIEQQIDRAAREEEDGDGEGGDGDLGDDGELYQEALEVLKATKRASTSMLQRRLRIGYNRAARIMEIMEEKGIVGPENGSSPREILVDLDSL